MNQENAVKSTANPADFTSNGLQITDPAFLKLPKALWNHQQETDLLENNDPEVMFNVDLDKIKETITPKFENISNRD